MNPASVVRSTNLHGLPVYRGKVRDVYDLGSELLLVATDRISAFDVVLPTGIPDKGRVLNQLSAFWFRRLADRCPNHLLSTSPERIAARLREQGVEALPPELAGRSMLVRKARALPAEFVVRGYLEGSGWREYQESGRICGIALPPGLKRGSRLPEPILTPTTKATVGHDESITHEQLMEKDRPELLQQAIEMSLAVYREAHAYAEERGILIADTKFEFGVVDDAVVMIDECLTPDSSRFWSAGAWAAGDLHSLDKQFVRNYLDESGWNHEPPAPELPAEIVRQTAERYREIYRRLTGADLEAA